MYLNAAGHGWRGSQWADVGLSPAPSDACKAETFGRSSAALSNSSAEARPEKSASRCVSHSSWVLERHLWHRAHVGEEIREKGFFMWTCTLNEWMLELLMNYRCISKDLHATWHPSVERLNLSLGSVNATHWLMVTRMYLKAICGLQDRDLRISHHYGGINLWL